MRPRAALHETPPFHGTEASPGHRPGAVGPLVRAGLSVLLTFIVLAALFATPRMASAQAPYEAEMRDIARVLACPVCQGLSVADSPSQLATQMRETILARLQAGESREAVIQYFVDRYGENILFDPPKQGFSLLIWWGPIIVLLMGGALLAFNLRRWVRRPQPAPEELLMPEELAAYRARVAGELARREQQP